MDEWPALLHRYTNLLSHAYSLSSSLLSASPHFLPSQLASFNKVLEAEAENSNLYADVSDSPALFGGGIMGGGVGSGNALDDGVKATADGLQSSTFTIATIRYHCYWRIRCCQFQTSTSTFWAHFFVPHLKQTFSLRKEA